MIRSCCLGNNSTVFEKLEMSIVDLTVANAVLRIFATVKSTTDTDNSLNTVLLLPKQQLLIIREHLTSPRLFYVWFVFVVLCFLVFCPRLVSCVPLHCPFGIAPSGFSNVCITRHTLNTLMLLNYLVFQSFDF